MTALYIIGGILLLLLILLMLRLKIYFLYYGKAISLRLSILGLKFTQDLAGAEVAGVQPEDMHKKQKGGEKKKRPEKTKKSAPLKDMLIILRDAVLDFWGKFKKYARLEKYSLKINLGTDDPAKTALLYGSLSGVVCSLHSFAEGIKNRPRKAGCVYTEFKPDFYAEKTDIAAEIGFSLRLWHIIACAMLLLKHYGSFKRLKGKPENNMKGETKDD